jgi:hypothetical protein
VTKTSIVCAPREIACTGVLARTVSVPILVQGRQAEAPGHHPLV